MNIIQSSIFKNWVRSHCVNPSSENSFHRKQINQTDVKQTQVHTKSSQGTERLQQCCLMRRVLVENCICTCLMVKSLMRWWLCSFRLQCSETQSEWMSRSCSVAMRWSPSDRSTPSGRYGSQKITPNPKAFALRATAWPTRPKNSHHKKLFQSEFS